MGSVLRRRFFFFTFIEIVVAALLAPLPAAAQGIGFVQVAAAVPQTAQSSVSIAFSGPQSAGNLNVVVVGWNDTTAQVQAVTDSRGNTYVRAVGPTVRSGLGTQSIYYAANITAAPAASNTITVTFNIPAQFVDMRIAEYRGIRQTSPVDVVAAAQGTGSTSSSGSVTTTNADSLLVGANLVSSRTTAAGTSFTSRIITNPDGDILEDRVVTTVGSYSATARTNGGAYIMQMVAFRAPAGGATPDTQPPSNPAGLAANAVSSSQINVAWSASTDNVGVTSYLIERCQGPGCVSFTQIGTSPTASYSDTTVSGSSTFSYRVRATDAANNLSGYSNVATAAPVPPDIQPPTAPGGATATAASSSQVTVGWTASTDNVGVTGYLIERCQGSGCTGFTQVGTSTTPGYLDTAVAASTSYSYRVRASDAANNLSPYSGTATVTTPGPPAGVALVQHASRDGGTVTSSSLAFASANSVGNWIAVAIRAGQTGQVFAVSDTRGNTYRKAAQLNETVDGTTLALYYAENIAAGPNTVTVSDSISGGTLRFAILEYSGVASASSLDGASTAQGTTALPDSGPSTASASGDLVLGLIATANPATLTAGPGFVIQERVPVAPNTKLFVEDRVIPGAGPVSATGTLGAADNWGALVAAFRAASVAPSLADLRLTKSHAGFFTQGQVGAIYTLSVSNVGATATSGQVTATDALPASLVATAISGSGWACTLTTATCVRSDALVAGASYPPITVTVTVAPNAPSTVTNVASVTGGGDGTPSNNSAADPTVIAAAPDTQPPTAPGSATASAGSSAQVTVTWSASADNIAVTGYLIERCEGVGCATFTQMGTSSTLSHGDNSVAASTTYSYRVRASDAAANLSAYSNVTTVTTPAPPDTQAPTAPAVLTATAATNQIDLNWTAATDNVGVTQYLVERCQGGGCTTFVQIATTSASAFSDAAVTIGTSYAYRVRALDAAGNAGSYSPVASAIVPDTQAPAAPAALVSSPVSASQVDLIWPAATDNVGVTQYRIERCDGAACTAFAQIATTAALTFSDTGLTSGTSYSYKVRAADAAGNLGTYSPISSATTPTIDTEAPTAPGTLTATATPAGQIDLSWPAATDNVAVTQYRIERCVGAGCDGFEQVATTAGTTFSDTGLIGATSYSYRVRAADAGGNVGLYSPAVSATTPDTQPPTGPLTLTATAVSASQVDLGWAAATDNVGVTLYLIERCQGAGCTTFVQIGTTSSPTFSNTGLQNGTTYGYRVRATDAANNLGPHSPVASAQTIDTQAPAAPAALTATAASPTQIDLSWPAASDNIAVTQYLIDRCQDAGCASFTQIATTAALTFSNGGLTNGTSYSYRVRATDAAGNIGSYSPVTTATTQTQDTQPPAAPSTLSSLAVSAVQVNLSWPAAADNVAATLYRIERCQGAGCTAFAQIATTAALTFINAGLTGGTTYSYRVRASDAAGNIGPYSPVANSTTPGAATIAFVQTANAVPQSSPSTVSVAYALAQTAGNLNVVAIGWNSSSGSVQSVQDTAGNVYTRAVGPTVRTGFATQSIYYAPNIRSATANANIVTVVFSAAVSHPDIRIAEYSGIATVNPVDVVAAAQGSGTSSNSGAATTTNANDLIVGANMVSTFTTGPGPSFTSRVITAPDGDILEDRVVSATGSYSAIAPLTSGAWIMQMVAFKAGAIAVDSQPPNPPSTLNATVLSSSDVVLTWPAAIDNVGVAGYRIERCAGSGCAGFGEIGTVASGTAFNDSGLMASTSYSYRVRAVDQAGNYSDYSPPAGVVTAAPDTEPPSAPANLAATAASGTRIDLAWTASVDNVAVSSYRVERCQGAGCTLFVKLATVSSPSFADTGLTPNTTYRYVVRAVDASSNLGDYSNEASATTLATIPELVAAYSFDEGAGGTVNDSSDKGNIGTSGGAQWTTAGKYGNALSFNGTSAKVVVPDSASLRLTTAMTLEAWVNPTAGNGGWTDVVYKGDDNYFLEAYSSAGGPAAGATIGNVNTWVPASSLLPINTWTHLAETYDGSTLRLYINGALAGSLARTGSIRTSANPLEIGGDSLYGQYFGGLIDEVRIFNVARTPSQIQADMNTPIGASLPVMSLSSAALDFGSMSTGRPSEPQVVVVTNVGGVTMAIGSIAVGGFNNGDFSTTTTCGASLAPSASCAITVIFTAAAAGARTASIQIADNAPGAPHTIALSGTGVGFTISPRTAVLTPNLTQQFSWTGGSPDVIFTVDGVPSGTATTGTVSATGVYTPPAASGVHVVTVSSADGSQISSATVYITTHPGVFTHHNDNARTGQNTAETVLTPANVTSATFGKIASFTLDGYTHASPLYVSGVNMPGKGIRNVVYVATEHNSVYAFDADGLSATPLWQVSFINPAAGVTTVPAGDTGECCDIAPEIGITATPVIDPSTGTLYVVAKTKEVTGSLVTYRQRLHALDITTGAEKFGGPVILQASVPGSGGGSQGGIVPFDALHENQRPALLLSNGVVYIAFGSHGDVQPYHGWLLGYNASTLQQVMAYNASPNADGAGMWQANGGPAADAAGNIYAITGNGRFDANTGGNNYGTSFLKVSPSGTLLDYFTPHNQATSSASNFDLGAAGPLLLPDQPGPHPRLVLSAGKDNTIYLVDRDSMGRYNASNDNQIVQSLVNIFPFGTPEPGNYSSPVYFNGTIYFGPVADAIHSFTLTNGLLSTSPTSSTSIAFAYPGATLAVSANGTANGILWAIQRNGDCGVQATCGSGAPGVLRAFHAGNLGVQLYSSDQSGTRDQLDFAAKFSVPVVANGKVFVTTSGRLTIFGLLQ